MSMEHIGRRFRFATETTWVEKQFSFELIAQQLMPLRLNFSLPFSVPYIILLKDYSSLSLFVVSSILEVVSLVKPYQFQMILRICIMFPFE